MRTFGLQRLVITVISLMIGWTCLADSKPTVDKEMQNIVKRFENVKGVECMSVVKGEGLELIKMALSKEFGRKFMKGVTTIVIIDYGSASEETCDQIRKSLDALTTVLEEFDLEDFKKEQAKTNKSADEDEEEIDYVRFFCKDVGDSKLSDFVIAMENDEEKMVMYMGGEIIME